MYFFKKWNFNAKLGALFKFDEKNINLVHMK